MTTTELINFLKEYEVSKKTGNPRQISLCINKKYYIPMSEFKLDGLTDGFGRLKETLFVGINGDVFQENEDGSGKTHMVDKKFEEENG